MYKRQTVFFDDYFILCKLIDSACAKWGGAASYLIKTYKTSVYHPSSNPAERVLREVGRILRTYCYDQHSKWTEYIPAAEDFINLSHHQFIDTTPYTAMFQRPPPREITSLIQFPSGAEYQFDNMEFHNRILEKTGKIRQRYKQL